MATSSSISVEKRTHPPFLHSAGNPMQSLTANILSHLPFSPPALPSHRASIAAPNPLTPSSPTVTVPFSLPFPSSSFYSHANKEEPSASPSIRSLSPSVKIDGVSSSSKGVGGGGGGPAFVGQVFSMLDPSGNGLMTVTSHFDIPFISRRTPEWIKRMLATVTKREQEGPVFRFFMDLSDAVAHVKRLNVPTGMVGACRLDVAYQHFKEEPHMFQFVPNEKQVKAANRLLKEFPTRGRRRKVDGVPVFTAQNLNIAIATNYGIKWSAASFPKAAALPSSRANSEDAKNGESEAQPSAPELSLNEDGKARQGQSTCHTAFQFPFGDWFSNPWSKSHEKANTRISGSEGEMTPTTCQLIFFSQR